MVKNLKYFMRENLKKEEIIVAPGPESIKDENGNTINLEIRVLPNSVIQKINDNYRKRTIALDKKGNPYISGNEVVFRTEFDAARASRHVIVEALKYPDLKDPELMKFFDCHDITDMPLLVFPRADEYRHVSNMVMTALGLREAATDEEEIEEAKNS